MVFLQYLEDWEKSVLDRPKFTALHKRKMLLSPETLVGLTITGVSLNLDKEYSDCLICVTP